MKSSTLSLLVIGLLTFTSTLSFAQTDSQGKVNLGINASSAFYTGTVADIYKPGFGFGASFDYYFSDRFDLGLEATYWSIPFESDLIDNANLLPVLLTAGLHKDAGYNLDVYGELGSGLYFFEGSNDFGLSPRIGIALDLSEKMFLNTQVNYTSVFTPGDNLSWFGVDFGLLFTIN